jgi:general secretion pathway protein D
MQIKKIHVSMMLIAMLSFMSISAAEDIQIKGASVQDDNVFLSFVDTDIESVIKAIGQISNKNFLIDPKVKGTININTTRPVPKAMAYQILLSALRVQGFTAVESNGITSIVPELDAKTRFTPSLANGKQETMQIATQVYVLKNESANNVITIVKPIMSANSVITAYPSNNSLIVTDYTDNLAKISKLIRSIDLEHRGENSIVQLKFASAFELSQIITKIINESTPVDTNKRLIAIPDARTNSIVFRADNISLINRAFEIIEKLDVPTNATGNSIHVVYLKNADATKLAATLRALMTIKGIEGIAGVTPNNINSLSTQNAAVMDPNKTITPISGDNSNRQTNLSSPFSPLASSQENGMVQADIASNSLLIAAPDHVYNKLLAVIDKLDIKRAQLYIEALIAEVSTDKASEFGVQWQELEGLNSTSNNLQAIAGTNFNKAGGNILGVAGNLKTAGAGLNIGILRGKVNIPGIGEVANLGLLAHALESNANANILSKPNILTLDNEEAKIVIGQNLPFLTGQYAQTNGSASVSPFQTIERQDVGLTLKVKTQISEGNTIKLAIRQEVSSVADTLNIGGVITNKRSIDTTVLVDDGSIIVLGGLIEDRVTDTVSKVPILGDLPGFGTLFRSVTRGHTKTNLMVFLRPYIMSNTDDATKISNARYNYIIQEQLKVTPKQVWPLPNSGTVTLPQETESSYNPKKN